MVFSQPTFLFAFLPLVLAAHLLAPRALRNVVLLGASLAFYAWGEGLLVALLVGSCLVNHLVGRRIVRAQNEGRSIGRAVAFGVTVNLSALVAFKYAAWILAELHTATGSRAVGDAAAWASEHLRLPLGISFFTFQAISFLVDLARRDAPAPRRGTDFALYLALFPQLVAGPIVRYRDLAAAIAERTLDSLRFAEGARRFVFGLAKKVLVADVVAGPADSIFALGPEGLAPALAWVGCLAYTLQIYFDFSGYSDMAIGIGLMLGFRLPENFRHPYASGSITEFWRRWHISLSTWFRDYLYIPLGGNRCGPLRTYANLGLVFLLCGLWHGAAWTFVVWGAYHGLLLVLERVGGGRLLATLPRAVAVTVTLALVMLGWVPFRAETLAGAGAMLSAMFGATGALAGPVALHVDPHELLTLALGGVLAFPVVPALAHRAERRTSPLRREAVASAWSLALLALALVAVSGQSHSPFLYFRF